MKWLKKTAVVSCAVGLLASFTAMVPTSHSTEAAIAVFDEKNIEEAIKTAIQTAKILTEEQKQLALQILNIKKLDVSMLTDLIKRNDKKTQTALAGDIVIPEGIINGGDKSVGAIWDERIGNIEDVINGNMTVYDMVIQEQKRQKAIHEASKSTAQVAQQTIRLDQQNIEDAKKALEASNKAEGQQQVLQAGNYLLYDILQSVSAGNRARAHMAASMAAYYDSKIQEQAESERILANSTNISKKWVENSR
jgi:conjugal transfer/entry exclusion protein